MRSHKNSVPQLHEKNKKDIVVKFVDSDDIVIDAEDHRVLTPPDSYSPSTIIKRQIAEEKELAMLSRQPSTDEKMRWEPTYRELGLYKDRHPSEFE